MSQAAPESSRPWACHTAEGSRSPGMKRWPPSHQARLHLLTWKKCVIPLWPLEFGRSLGRMLTRKSLEPRLLVITQLSPPLRGLGIHSLDGQQPPWPASTGLLRTSLRQQTSMLVSGKELRRDRTLKPSPDSRARAPFGNWGTGMAGRMKSPNISLKRGLESRGSPAFLCSHRASVFRCRFLALVP